MESKKVLIVEGKSDKIHLQKVLNEPTTIICTLGTISEYDLDELLDKHIDTTQDEVFVFVDADYTGERIRTLFNQNYPEAIHLYTNEDDIEVEKTPLHLIAAELRRYFQVKPQYL